MTVRARTTRRYNPARFEEAAAGWLAIMPWLVGFLIFTAGPFVASLYFSFTEYQILSRPVFVGLKNYQEILSNDPLFLTSLRNSIVFTALYVPLHVITALGVALLLNKASRLQGLFRTLFYLPSITPAVATAILWVWILNPNDGLVNRILRFLHLPAPLWTVDPFWAKPSIVIQSLWGLGGAMIIFLAGLKNIPPSLYEAAELDGATGWQRFRFVTLPLLSGVTFFVATMSLISSLQVFTQGFVMFDKDGGPRNSALFYIMYLFKQGFEYFRMGYASALAWLLFIVISVVTVIQFKLAKRWVFYETES